MGATCTAYAHNPATGYTWAPLRPCGQPATHLSTLTARPGVTLHTDTLAQYPQTAPRCTPCVERIAPALANLSILDHAFTPIPPDAPPLAVPSDVCTICGRYNDEAFHGTCEQSVTR